MMALSILFVALACFMSHCLQGVDLNRFWQFVIGALFLTGAICLMIDVISDLIISTAR